MKRRHYLAAVGASTVALAGCPGGDSGTETATPADGTASSDLATAVESMDRFEETVGLVATTDCDPTGEQSCAGAIESAARPGRALVLPEGRYALDRPVTLDGDGPVALVGDGTATLAPTQGFNGMAVTADVPTAVMGGFDVDIQRPETTAGLTVRVDQGFRVADITYRGRGDHPGESSPFAFNLAVRNADGRGVASNLTATRGAAIGQYKGGGGRGGVWIGPKNDGTVRLAGCHIEEFANNGVYASRTTGDVEVVGGIYRNNNVASVRVGGEGSFVENATIDVDIDAYDGPTTAMDEAFSTRGVVVEQGPETDSKPPGAAIRNCDITVASSPAPGAGVSVWSTGRTLSVVDSSITVDVDGYRALFRAPQVPLGDREPSSFPRSVHLDGVDIGGQAADSATVELADAPDSTLRDTTIRRRGGGSTGVRLARSPGTDLHGGRIDVDGPLALIDGLDQLPDDACLLRASGGISGGEGGPLAMHTADVSEVSACLSARLIGRSRRGGSIEVVSLAGDRIFYRLIDRQ